MISRRAGMAIAEAYTRKFSSRPSPRSGKREKVHRESLFDFLYENDYEAWFCNMVQHLRLIRSLKEWLLRIHTGESLASATPNWSWEKRMELGQTYLKNMARDFIVWYQENSDKWVVEHYQAYHDEMIRRLEMDGYVFREKELLQTEVEVLDVEAEKGLLEALHAKLRLPDGQNTFKFLKLSEDHYVAGRWSDCIGNARKFFEAMLRQVAIKYSIVSNGSEIAKSSFDRPVAVRAYLETQNLLEKKEREAVDKLYGLLSHTGGHPYMAEQDQARLLRQICLSITQFIMLRLEGALLKTGSNN